MTDGARGKRSIAPVYSKMEAGRKVTETLDMLFEESGYDMRFRPGLGGSPTEITVNIFIRSMGPIDEGLQKFTFDCYFRQFWTDRRLAYNNSNADFKVGRNSDDCWKNSNKKSLSDVRNYR